MSYQDRHTRFHHKPCNGGLPSSNNGWIYTAYARHLLPEKLDPPKLIGCLNQCTVFKDEFKINRNINQITPPFSRDEVIGVLSIFRDSKAGEDLYQSLKDNHWNFCNFWDYEKEPLTLKKIWTAVKSLWKIRKEHRNYFWHNKMEEVYCLAFRLPPQDIIYLKMLYGDKTNWLEREFLKFSNYKALEGEDKSEAMIAWLKLMDSGVRPSRKTTCQVISNYFDKNHPFVLTYK